MKNREILFRGKRVDNGEWVEGNLINDGKRKFILQKETPIWVNYIEKEDSSYNKQIRVIVYEVIPETVSQFTGLTDKNGTRIFEGDTDQYGGTVVYDTLARFCIDYGHKISLAYTESTFEISGNIHDNLINQ